MASSVGFCCSSSSSTFMSSQLFRHNNNVSLNSSVSGTCFPHTSFRVGLPLPQSSCYGSGDGAAAGKSTREWQSRGSPPPPPAPSLGMEVNAKRQNTFFTLTDLCSRIDLSCVSTGKEKLRWLDILSSSCWWEGSCLLQCHSASPNHSFSSQKECGRNSVCIISRQWDSPVIPHSFLQLLIWVYMKSDGKWYFCVILLHLWSCGFFPLTTS